MKGFGVEELRDLPEYNIVIAVDGFTAEYYGILVGPAYTAVYASLLLFTGALSDQANRKNMLLLSCLGWSLATWAHSYAEEI